MTLKQFQNKWKNYGLFRLQNNLILSVSLDNFAKHKTLRLSLWLCFFQIRWRWQRVWSSSMRKKNVQLPPKVTTLINISNQILSAKKRFGLYFYLMKRFGLFWFFKGEFSTMSDNTANWRVVWAERGPYSGPGKHL